MSEIKDSAEPEAPSSADAHDIGERARIAEGEARDDLVAARAKGAELDERLAKLEDEALPKPRNVPPIGGMVGV